MQIRALKTSQCVDNCYFIGLITVIFLASPNFPCSRLSLYNSDMEISSKLRITFGKDQQERLWESWDKSKGNISVAFYGFVILLRNGRISRTSVIVNIAFSKNESVKISLFEALAKFQRSFSLKNQLLTNFFYKR